MSALVVNMMRDFVAGLDLSSKVLSLSDDGTNTTLIVENVFHIRPIDGRTVAIDGTDYEVFSVDYDTNTVVVSGVIPSASIYKVPNPFYFHGTLISTGNEIKCIDSKDKCPMIYLNEIITSTRHLRLHALQETANIRLAFADFYSNDWTREDHYDKSIAPLCNLSDFVFSKLDKNSCLRFESDVSQSIVPKWGVITRKGTTEKVFNEYLDAIEWKFDLGICNC